MEMELAIINFKAKEFHLFAIPLSVWALNFPQNTWAQDIKLRIGFAVIFKV